MGFFSKLFGVIRKELKLSSTYKFEMFITVLIAPISMTVFYFLWKAIYANTGAEVIKGFTFNQLMTYYILGWVVGVAIYTHIEDALMHEVRHGRIIRHLLKPINFLQMHFYHTLGHRLYGLAVEIVPIFLIGLIFFSISIKPSSVPFFAIALFLAIALNYLISACIGMTAFWLTNIRGISKMKSLFVYFLSGAVLPISFFPPWFQKVSAYLPFQYLNYIPINMWLGKYSGAELYRLLAVQLLWVLFFLIIASIIWNYAMKKTSSVGV